MEKAELRDDCINLSKKCEHLKLELGSRNGGEGITLICAFESLVFITETKIKSLAIHGVFFTPS